MLSSKNFKILSFFEVFFFERVIVLPRSAANHPFPALPAAKTPNAYKPLPSPQNTARTAGKRPKTAPPAASLAKILPKTIRKRPQTAKNRPPQPKPRP
jgi:hypothetical protein